MQSINGSAPEDMKATSDDLLVEVLRFLSPESGLSSCYLVSRQLSRCVQMWDEALWRPHVEALWRSCGWSHNIPADISVYNRVKRLSMAQLREKLRECDTIRCLEKDEFCRHLVAYLSF